MKKRKGGRTKRKKETKKRKELRTKGNIKREQRGRKEGIIVGRKMGKRKNGKRNDGR